jgi:hypothetical protein
MRITIERYDLIDIVDNIKRYSLKYGHSVFELNPEKALDTWLYYIKNYKKTDPFCDESSFENSIPFNVNDSLDQIEVILTQDDGRRYTIILSKWDTFSEDIKKRYKVTQVERDEETKKPIKETTWWFDDETEWIDKIHELGGYLWRALNEPFKYHCDNNGDIIAEYIMYYEQNGN